MKLDPELISNALKDYLSFGRTSSAYLMRKYKLSREIANGVVREIDKIKKYRELREKNNFIAKRTSL